MNRYSLLHLSNGELLQSLSFLVARDRATTADLIAHIAEAEHRRLYAPAGYPSMHAYCVHNLHLSEDSAYKRIQAARAARKSPQIFEAVADGRLTLTAVVRLAPHLTPENSAELLAESEWKTKTEIEHLLAGRFPQADVPTLIQPLASGVTHASAAVPVVPVAPTAVAQSGAGPAVQLVPEPVGEPGRTRHPDPVQASRVAPLSAEKYKSQATISKSTHDLLRRAQDLLGHQVRPGDVDEVLRQALGALVAQLEKKKFAATSRPARPAPQESQDPRHIPAHVKRAVCARDGGRCTFVGDGGRRCEARRDLEFDHAIPVARGGRATSDNIRLRCRAHNQLEAEREFGHALMKGRREAAAKERRDFVARPATPSPAPRATPHPASAFATPTGACST